MIYVRGQPEDFDHWGQLGNRGWSWDDVLPYFKRAENWEGGADDFHGTGGPLLTSRTSDKPELCQKMIDAGTEIGLEYHEDVNHLPPGAGDNIGWVQQTRRGRRRQSAARTYLRPAMRRQNLQVVTDALVHRVLFDGKRAVGVEFSRGGQAERAEAWREVILSGGAIGSPHVLQLSGIGDPDHLGRIGVPVAMRCPGSARTCRTIFWRASPPRSPASRPPTRSRAACRLSAKLMRYVFAGTGLLTYAASLVSASVKVLEESATPDVQILFANASFAPGPIRRLDDKPGMTGGMWQMRPLSRGYVEAKSPDPHQAPAINPRYLSQETDRRCRDRRLARGAPAVRRAGAGAVLRRRNPAGRKVQSDDELLDYLRQTGSTVFHATCTCKMGRDPMAVVDDELRVHGIDGLAGDRRLGDADRDLDQHQRADHHDRRKRRRRHPRRRPPTAGRVAQGKVKRIPREEWRKRQDYQAVVARGFARHSESPRSCMRSRRQHRSRSRGCGQFRSMSARVAIPVPWPRVRALSDRVLIARYPVPSARCARHLSRVAGEGDHAKHGGGGAAAGARTSTDFSLSLQPS